MRRFITDEVNSEPTNQREAMIHEIQRLLPEFNPEGKSDDYVRAYYEALQEKYMEKATSNDKAEDSEGYDKDSEKEKDDIEKKKQERLNMRTRKANEKNDSSDCSMEEIEKNKQARLNMRGR